MLGSRAALIGMIVATSTAASAQRAPAQDSGDLVETIPPDDATVPSTPPVSPPSAPPSAPPVAPVASRSPSLSLSRPPHSVELRGWARASALVGLYLTGPTTPPEHGYVPHDRLVATQQMFLRLRYAYARSFEVVASGLLAFDAYEQDAPAGDTFNLINGVGSRTAFDASLREAYVGAFWRSFDFRLGQQRIAWGRGDAFTPNDILDGYDLREQLIPESDAYHLPSFAARAGLDLGFGSLEAVVQPFFQPNRFDVYGGNWALVQPGAPLSYITLLNLANQAISPTLHDALQPLLGQTQLPPNDFTATSAAARFGVDVHRFDFNVYYQYGWDRTPKLEIDPQYAALLHQIDYAKPIDPMPYLAPFLAGQEPVRATYVRRHHVGADVAISVGPLLFRAEWAYDTTRVLIARDDMHGVIAPVVQATTGIRVSAGRARQGRDHRGVVPARLRARSGAAAVVRATGRRGRRRRRQVALLRRATAARDARRRRRATVQLDGARRARLQAQGAADSRRRGDPRRRSLLVRQLLSRQLERLSPHQVFDLALEPRSINATPYQRERRVLRRRRRR